MLYQLDNDHRASSSIHVYLLGLSAELVMQWHSVKQQVVLQYRAWLHPLQAMQVLVLCLCGSVFILGAWRCGVVVCLLFLFCSCYGLGY